MNRVVLTVIILVIAAVWFAAIANACSPSTSYAGDSRGSFWPVFVGGGGWNQGGWDRGTTTSKPSSGSSASRSIGGSIRGGGISGGSGGK